MSNYTFFKISIRARRFYSIILGAMLLIVANIPALYIPKYFNIGYSILFRYTYFMYFIDVLGLFFLRFGVVKYFCSHFAWAVYSSILSLTLILVAFIFAMYVIKWNVAVGIIGSLFFYSGVLWYTYEIGQVCSELVSDRG